jgi:hypothetical protein
VAEHSALVWLVASTARALLGLGGGWGAALRVVPALALGWWAVDEIGRGECFAR